MSAQPQSLPVEGAADPDGAGLFVRFLGHSTALIGLDGVRLLTDPVLRNVGPLRRHGPPAHASAADVDVVLISHGHHDHLDLPSLRRLRGEPLVVAPAGLGRVLKRAGLTRIHEVRAGDELEVGGGVRVLAVPALHDGSRPLGPRSAALGFLVGGSAGIYFAGDTDVFPDMARLRGSVDLALLPVWGWGPFIGPGHMNPRRAAEAAGLVGARVSVPIHWGTLFLRGLHRVWPTRLTSPPIDFARSVEEAGVPTEVRILRPGESTVVLPPPAAAE